MQKILVIRFSSLGDLVLTTPLYRELKRVFPNSHLTLLTADPFGRILENNPHIDHMIFHQRQETRQMLETLIATLQKQSFDLVYDAHASLRSRWVVRQLKKKQPSLEVCSIRKRGWQRSLWIHTPLKPHPDFASQRHIFLEPLQQQTELQLDAHTELFPGNQAQQTVSQWLKQQGVSKPLVAISPSASFPGKCWPLRHFSEVIQQLLQKEHQVVLMGGRNEWEVLELQKQFGKKVLVAAGVFDLQESTALLQKVEWVLSNDTALGHMAEAVGVPTHTIFGPTIREFGYAPFLEKSQLLDVNLPCRPCTRNGKGPCRIATPRLCLSALSPETVLNSLPLSTAVDHAPASEASTIF